MLYIWSVIPRRGCLHIVGGGSRHIKKAFIDALFWRVETSQLSDCVQDLATVDVLRDIDYPPCAYWCWYTFCVYVYAHTHLNYVAREYIYIRRGLRVVGLTQWAMRRPQLVERQQSDSTLFFICLITKPQIRIVGSSYARKNRLRPLLTKKQYGTLTTME